MKKIKFSIKRLSDGKAIQRCKDLKEALDKEPAMKDAPQEFTDFSGAITTAEAKVTASNVSGAASKDATLEKDLAIGDLQVKAAALIDYLQYFFKGDEQAISGVGLETRAANGLSSVPGKVINLSAVAGDVAGRLDVRWDRLSGSVFYKIEVCADPVTESGWKSYDSVRGVKAALTGLASGTRVWVRVCGVNKLGAGAWSNPAARIVP